MNSSILKNKPLVEAIFELRWSLAKTTEGPADPYYKILPGAFFEKVKSDYTFYESLPTAELPEELAAQIVQHRFRVKKDVWPLVQMGPGILTLNDTSGYSWENFKGRANKMLGAFHKAHSQPDNLRVKSLLLRYIDAVPFEFKDNVFKFLEEKMKIRIGINPGLIEKTNINPFPQSFNMRFSFPMKKPVGVTTIAVASGKSKGVESLIWETMVGSSTNVIPYDIKSVITWLEDAHTITHECFFEMIRGELHKRFE